MTHRAILFAVLAFAITTVSHADSEDRKDHLISLGAAAGLPSLVGLEVRLMPFSRFDLGAAIGMLPVNSVLNKAVKIEPIPMDLVPGQEYKLYPSVRYQLTSFGLMGRVFPLSKYGLFLQGGYSILRFRADLNTTLRNETNNTSFSGVVSGSLEIQRPLANLLVGYQIFTGIGLFFDIGLGASYQFRPRTELEIGGTVASIAPLIPEAGEALEEAKAEVKAQVDEALANAYTQIRFLPNAVISIGYAF